MQKCNIVLISLDAVRADHLSIYGYSRDTMPFLSGFSRESILCDNAYSSSNWTLPSHVSMVTGSPMSQHGIGSDKTRLRKMSDPRLITMAEYLRAQGYQTAAFTNSVYLSNETFFDRGFMNFHWMGEMIGRNHPLYASRVLGKYWGRTLNKIYTDRIYELRDQGAHKTYKNYRTWLRHIRKDGTPFFSFIHLSPMTMCPMKFPSSVLSIAASNRYSFNFPTSCRIAPVITRSLLTVGYMSQMFLHSLITPTVCSRLPPT